MTIFKSFNQFMSQESTFESPWPHEALHDFVLTIALDYS